MNKEACLYLVVWPSPGSLYEVVTGLFKRVLGLEDVWVYKPDEALSREIMDYLSEGSVIMVCIESTQIKRVRLVWQELRKLPDWVPVFWHIRLMGDDESPIKSIRKKVLARPNSLVRFTQEEEEQAVSPEVFDQLQQLFHLSPDEVEESCRAEAVAFFSHGFRDEDLKRLFRQAQKDANKYFLKVLETVLEKRPTADPRQKQKEPGPYRRVHGLT